MKIDPVFGQSDLISWLSFVTIGTIRCSVNLKPQQGLQDPDCLDCSTFVVSELSNLIFQLEFLDHSDGRPTISTSVPINLPCRLTSPFHQAVNPVSCSNVQQTERIEADCFVLV